VGVFSTHDRLPESLSANMDVGLLDGREGPHLEHITLDAVESVVDPV
jgi:hypothetical protein